MFSKVKKPSRCGYTGSLKYMSSSLALDSHNSLWMGRPTKTTPFLRQPFYLTQIALNRRLPLAGHTWHHAMREIPIPAQQPSPACIILTSLLKIWRGMSTGRLQQALSSPFLHAHYSPRLLGCPVNHAYLLMCLSLACRLASLCCNLVP